MSNFLARWRSPARQLTSVVIRPLEMFIHRFLSSALKVSLVRRPYRCMSSNDSNRLHSFGTRENEPLYEATIRSIESLSPSVKQFHLSVDDPSNSFRFHSGMFLDFYFPPSITPIVTGFSICNTPLDYSKTNLIELAIKRTDYPPTKHMFDHSRVNEKIFVRPGGNFFYQSAATKDDSILLLCAGIGANPIVSILRHLLDLHQTGSSPTMPHRVEFLYTAATATDLVFRSSIDVSCQSMIRDNVLQVHYFVTREMNNDADTNNRRLNETDLTRAIEWLGKPTTAYLCGPPSFIHWAENVLAALNVKRIFYEKWW